MPGQDERGRGRGGRTVLFVSHNMAAIEALTNSVILLDASRVVAVGSPASVINDYLQYDGDAAKVSLSAWTDRSTNGKATIKSIEFPDRNGRGS